MAYTSKRKRKIAGQVDANKKLTVKEAVEKLQSLDPVKFDQSVDISMKLGVDPRKSDQSVRGTVSLPHGTGKNVRVLVFAQGDKVKEALDAGAEYAGFTDYYDKVKNGWTDFDAVIVTPDLMREVGKLGKILGPRNLMPTPKAGTVTQNVAEAVNLVKAGQIEFKMDKHSQIHSSVGKISFTVEGLQENIQSLMSSIMKAKPNSAKGQYLKSVFLSSTMGPGLQVDLSEFVS